MGLFSFLKNNGNGQFVSAPAFENQVAKQMQMTPLTMKELRKLDVTEDKELKLEYFFYTNTAQKASVFAQELEKLKYEVKSGQSAGDKKLFIITGWTTKMKMDDVTVSNWTTKMCELGFNFDCEFDGWGTTPDQ
ncbi:ribonuclease E inhibitor RraB [Mucilaginibacter gotjawali]|uniref:Regulator of RNase E activity RraB n=1 Tax=Mucilaginibacter gotjawali TaxID=1550579 RepID=A0A839SA24_9SPHI|nr:ribonuclease E inhibitor RraB [Mucilaginibacter gotjawali]MBB3054686.1 regulator of RNase E activity RraB [Mucilaginibacter gotjawali]